MAKFEINIPRELEQKLEALERNSGEILDRCVVAGGDVLENAVRNSLRGVLSNEHKNGELINALGTSPAKTDREGVHNVKVGFSEPRRTQPKTKNGKKGKRSYYTQTNAMIANVLEHGRSNQQARPFLTPAVNSSESAVLAAIEKTYDEEVAKL